MKPVYVHKLYVVQPVYACGLNKSRVHTPLENFKKKKKILGKLIGQGRLVGIWNMTRDPKMTQ
jgi:hypothetical protein